MPSDAELSASEIYVYMRDGLLPKIEVLRPLCQHACTKLYDEDLPEVYRTFVEDALVKLGIVSLVTIAPELYERHDVSSIVRQFFALLWDGASRVVFIEQTLAK